MQMLGRKRFTPNFSYPCSLVSVSFVGQLMKSATSRNIEVQIFFRHETRYTCWNTQDVKGLLLRWDDSFLAAVLLDSPRPFMVQQRSFPRAMPQQIGISKCLSAIHRIPQLEKASCCWHKFGSLHTCRGRNLDALGKPQGWGIAGKKTNRRRRDEGTIDHPTFKSGAPLMSFATWRKCRPVESITVTGCVC